MNQEFTALKHGDDDFRNVAVYGGAEVRQQIIDIQRGAEVVVGTPGRLLDMLNR